MASWERRVTQTLLIHRDDDGKEKVTDRVPIGLEPRAVLMSRGAPRMLGLYADVYTGYLRTEDVYLPSELASVARPSERLHRETGIALDSKSAAAFTRWLKDQLTEGGLEKRYALEQPTWEGDQLCVPGINVEATAKAPPFGTVGEREDATRAWREIATTVVEQGLHRLAVIIGASVISPQLGRLRARSFTVHSQGSTTSGKTVGTEVAMAVWGDPTPDGLGETWNVTANAINAMLAKHALLPVFLDETAEVQDRDRSRFLSAIVMDVATGHQRRRANRSGELAESATWRLVLLSTGEHRLTSETTTGDAARVLELPAPIMPDAATADRLHALALAHHGWPGKLLTERDWAPPKLPRLTSESPVAARLAPSVAACAAGFAELCAVLDVNGFDVQHVGQVILDERAADVMEQGESVGERLWALITEAYHRNPSLYPRQDQIAGTISRDYDGVRADGRLYVYPSALRKIAGELDQKVGLRELQKAGRLVLEDTGGGRTRQSRVKVGSGRARVYAFAVEDDELDTGRRAAMHYTAE